MANFCWAWVGTMVNRKLEDNCYSEVNERVGKKLDITGYGVWK